MNLVFKAARDFITADVDRVLIDDEEEYRKVRDFLQLLGPQYIGRLEYYNSGRSLFDDFKIDEELAKLMRPKINLPSGALDRDRVDRSVNGHRRKLRQIHRRPESRRHDPEDQHRSRRGDRAASAPARHRRHHRRRLHRYGLRVVAREGRQNDGGRTSVATALARRYSRSRISGCSSSRASASAKISEANCAARVRLAAEWAASCRRNPSQSKRSAKFATTRVTEPRGTSSSTSRRASQCRWIIGTKKSARRSPRGRSRRSTCASTR